MSTILLQDLAADTTADAAMEPTYASSASHTCSPACSHGSEGYGKKSAMSCMSGCNSGFWLTCIIVVIVIIVLLCVAYSGREWYASLNNEWTWTNESNNVIMGIILVVVVLLLAYVSWVAYSSASSGTRWWIGCLYILILILLVTTFCVFYGSHSITAACWLSAFTFLASLVLAWFVYCVSPTLAFGVLIFSLWSLVCTCLFWHLADQNPDE